MNKFLVRSRLAGVFVNCVEVPLPEGAPGADLPGMLAFKGRRLWSWEGAGECQQIALEGCESNKLAPEGVVMIHYCDLAGIHPMTAEAVERLEQIPPWTGT